MNETDINKSNLIKLALYGGFFFIIIILALFSNNKSNTNNINNNNNKTPNEQIIEKIKNINEEYCFSKIQLTMDDDALNLEVQKIKEIEMGVKKYHGEKVEYTKYNNNYYKLENDKFIKLENFIDFNYDKTFMEIANIKKLFSLEGEKRTYTYDELNVLSTTYDLSDVIKIYNEYNNTNIIKFTNGKVTLEVYYKNEGLAYIIINTTDLYNLINNENQNNVNYKIEIKSNKEEDTSWLIEKLPK